MTDPYRLRGTPTRIIVEEKNGHWIAWFEDRQKRRSAAAQRRKLCFG